MGASITLAGESLIAQKQGAQQILTVSRFILANVPGLDPNGPVDRAAGKPAAGQIVGTYDVTDAGYVNPNQVVYSLMLGSDIGDFDWNWIGLETAENVLLMVAYVPTQQKRRNIPPLQLGNNVTRNFLLVFDGAQALTGLTIDASTWQHDFTVRLAGIDERERQSNRDIFGRACFFGSALQLEKVGGAYQLKPGTAYVEGVRLQRAAALAVVPPAFPTTAWLDVALQRELNDVVTSWSVVWGAGKVDYVDSAGVQHYCVAIADLPNSNTITDSRPVENIAGPLVAHFAARVGDYAGLRARSTTKDDVGLGNLPNAKSDDPASNSSEILATTKAVMAVLSRAVQNATNGATDTATDWNTITTAGLFPQLLGANNANGPDSTANAYRYALVIKHDTNALTQLALPYTGALEGEFEWRTKSGESWTPWRRMRHSGSAKVHSFTASVTLNAAQVGTVLLNATAGNLVCTLPASNVALGVVDLIVRRVDNSANRVTIQAAGTDKVKFHTHLNAAGYGFFYLMGAGDWWHLRADGAGGWLPIGRLDPSALGRPVFETTTAFQPGGWGAFSGPLMQRAEWPWLWDHAQQSGMLTAEANRTGMEGGWTSGDGAATFRGPDGRGEFLRLLDESRGVDRFDVTGTLTNGSNTVSAVVFDGNRTAAGMSITGTGIPAGTTIIAVGANTLTLSANATASAVGLTLTVAGRVAGSSAPDAIAKHRHPQYEYDSGNSVPIPDGSKASDLNANYTIGYDRTSLIGYFGGPETKPRSLAYPGRMKLL
ncbi:tail-collar fiber protein [Pseudomonas sp. SJZ085]|uniref:phage tail-collar fiber domain-containing protein n=1 Tax=unclassified Pseudomonas TaxID=196821 RepID=UPI0011990D8D|nr:MULTISPECIES: phage tail protein [unclassified Pseudomonas]TWC14790.1 tail-collar fiber protein [Pseudomonas sp. SJZ074]TWC33074.1 tail-collar fiber protein [Pseudomonas sp. SJZ085]